MLSLFGGKQSATSPRSGEGASNFPKGIMGRIANSPFWGKAISHLPSFWRRSKQLPEGNYGAYSEFSFLGESNQPPPLVLEKEPTTSRRGGTSLFVEKETDFHKMSHKHEE